MVVSILAASTNFLKCKMFWQKKLVPNNRNWYHLKNEKDINWVLLASHPPMRKLPLTNSDDDDDLLKDSMVSRIFHHRISNISIKNGTEKWSLFEEWKTLRGAYPILLSWLWFLQYLLCLEILKERLAKLVTIQDPAQVNLGLVLWTRVRNLSPGLCLE